MRAKNQTLGEQAARFSLYAPFVVFLIAAIGRGSHEPGVAIALVSINMLLILAGFVLGIFALVSIRRYGSQYILGRAIGGLLLNGMAITVILIFVLPLLLAGNTKGKVAGHWHGRSVATGPQQKQVDVTFNPDGTFHFVGSGDSGSFSIDGRWVMDTSRVIGLIIERSDGGAPRAGAKIRWGKVNTIDGKQLVLSTEDGEEVYDRVP
jgi:hypothetical protein